MIVPVNVAPQNLPSPVQNQPVARQQFQAGTSPDLHAATSLKKSAGLQAGVSSKETTSMVTVDLGQELVGKPTIAENVVAKNFLPQAVQPAAIRANATASAASVPVALALPPVKQNFAPLVAQAVPEAPAVNNGMPADIPPLDQIPTLQPQTQEMPAVPTSRPESVNPQSGSQPESVAPQSGGTPQAQPPADGSVQTFPQPSQVLPETNPTTPPQPTGNPPQEPGNYLNNQPGNAPYYNQNYIGPAVSFSNDTSVGAVSRFGWGKNISVRPSLFLGNTTRIAVPVTYDFGFNNNEQFEPNPLVVFHAGGGLDYSSAGNGQGSRLNPLIVAGADIYFGDGASVLLQVGNTFNSNFVGVVGVGLQF
jgi:hypothetical protein